MATMDESRIPCLQAWGVSIALLMDKVAEDEGVRLYEENERLRRDPAAEVPPEFDRKSREAIIRAFQELYGK